MQREAGGDQRIIFLDQAPTLLLGASFDPDWATWASELRGVDLDVRREPADLGTILEWLDR